MGIISSVNRIKHARIACRVTHRDMCEKLRMTSKQLRAIESTGVCSYQTLRNVADALGVEISYFTKAIMPACVAQYLNSRG